MASAGVPLVPSPWWRPTRGDRVKVVVVGARGRFFAAGLPAGAGRTREKVRPGLAPLRPGRAGSRRSAPAVQEGAVPPPSGPERVHSDARPAQRGGTGTSEENPCPRQSSNRTRAHSTSSPAPSGLPYWVGL